VKSRALGHELPPQPADDKPHAAVWLRHSDWRTPDENALASVHPNSVVFVKSAVAAFGDNAIDVAVTAEPVTVPVPSVPSTLITDDTPLITPTIECRTPAPTPVTLELIVPDDPANCGAQVLAEPRN
jgi:hypothetical protein